MCRGNKKRAYLLLSDGCSVTRELKVELLTIEELSRGSFNTYNEMNRLLSLLGCHFFAKKKSDLVRVKVTVVLLGW